MSDTQCIGFSRLDAHEPYRDRVGLRIACLSFPFNWRLSPIYHEHGCCRHPGAREVYHGNLLPDVNFPCPSTRKHRNVYNNLQM